VTQDNKRRRLDKGSDAEQTSDQNLGQSRMAGTWIFQVNPNRFDIDAFLATRPRNTKWLVTRYGADIKIGDPVFIWRAAGTREPSGIIAKAEVISTPAEGRDDPKSLPFWKSEVDKNAIALRVGIRLTEIAKPQAILRRDALMTDPALESLKIIRMPNGTNYRVDPEQSQRLDKLWLEAAKEWSNASGVNHWRMAMSVGRGGYEMWDQCFKLGVAAITYDGIAETDFSDMSFEDATSAWIELAPAQKASMRCLAYEMQGGDIIYAKQGSQIVGKGIVRGVPGERAYAYDAASPRIVDPNGTPWLQQVRVSWINDFEPLVIEIGSSQQFAIQQLNETDVTRLEGLSSRIMASTPIPALDQDDALLSTESYLRADAARLRIISRHHNELSNAFAHWLKSRHSVAPSREKKQVDVRFKFGTQSVLVELKVCYGLSTRHAIRDALGQLLEYNYYPARSPDDVWLVVLDAEPSSSDKQYVEILRKDLSFPLFLGWRLESGFVFHPGWPD
jgi:hypothetical protein